MARTTKLSNPGAQAAKLRAGFNRFLKGAVAGPTENEIGIDILLDQTAVNAAIADMEAKLGTFDQKLKRSLGGARNKLDVVRRLERAALQGKIPLPAEYAANLPADIVDKAAKARMRYLAKGQPDGLLSKIGMSRQNLFRLAQRGPSQLVSSLFGQEQALGLGGATLAGIAAVKALTTVLGMAANYREFRRQGNNVLEATKRTALTTVQKVVTGLANITGVSAGAGDFAAMLGGTDTDTGRRVVREEMERWFETAKERRERERAEARDYLKTRAEALVRDYSQYLKLAQSFMDASPVGEYAVVRAIQEGLQRFGSESRTALRDIFGRPIWNVVRRAGIDGAH